MQEPSEVALSLERPSLPSGVTTMWLTPILRSTLRPVSGSLVPKPTRGPSEAHRSSIDFRVAGSVLGVTMRKCGACVM